MDIARLKRLLHKEFTRSPVKTGVLIVMCPVAIYFIVPLFLPKQDKTKLPVAESTSPEIQLVTLAPSSPEAPRQGDWRELVKQIQQDQRMLTAELDPQTRNPFEFIADPLDEEPEEVIEESRADEGAEIAAHHGLVLSATMVSRRMQMATINGRTYRVRDEIVFNDDDVGSDLRETPFQLVEVGPRHAIVERRGRRILLELPKREVAGIRILKSD